tara:strand:+ start:1859 stop:2065 length:207 start_codon:yes stop_codon:yes gene_type:complete
MRLSAWLKDQKLTQKTFHSLCSEEFNLNVSSGTIAKWCAGTATPRGKSLLVIEEMTDKNVTLRDFIND